MLTTTKSTTMLSVRGGRRTAFQPAKPSLQTIGEKTFYWKNDRWSDAQVTAEGEKNPVRIKAFSDDYFRLAAQANGRFAKYLTLDGAILIVLEGKTVPHRTGDRRLSPIRSISPRPTSRRVYPAGLPVRVRTQPPEKEPGENQIAENGPNAASGRFTGQRKSEQGEKGGRPCR